MSWYIHELVHVEPQVKQIGTWIPLIHWQTALLLSGPSAVLLHYLSSLVVQYWTAFKRANVGHLILFCLNKTHIGWLQNLAANHCNINHWERDETWYQAQGCGQNSWGLPADKEQPLPKILGPCWPKSSPLLHVRERNFGSKVQQNHFRPERAMRFSQTDGF